MLRRQFLHFCVAGVLGFLVDAGLVELLVKAAGVGPYLARVVSVSAAILTTFTYNREISFRASRSDRPLREFGRYLLGNAGGLSVNYGTYAACIAGLALAREWPVLAVAAGSVAGMLVNFASARYFVFVARESGGPR